MIYSIFDTNVIVSAFLKPSSVPGNVLRTIGRTDVRPVLTEEILAEYVDVLSRKKFSFDAKKVEKFLSDFVNRGLYIFPASIDLEIVDPKDRPFLECLAAAQKKELDAFIITGNGKHFPKDSRILTPREYLDLF